MILNYAIKHNGIDYPIGSDVPLEETPLKASLPIEKKVEPEVDESVKEESIQDEIKVEEPVADKKFTKTEINRMSTAELKDLAKKNGIKDDFTGGELKKMLIDKLV